MNDVYTALVILFLVVVCLSVVIHFLFKRSLKDILWDWITQFF